MLLWVRRVRLVQNLVGKARVVTIAASLSRSRLLRTNSTLLLAVNGRVVRVDVVWVLARFAAVYFNVLSEIPDILGCVVLVICDLRVTQVRVTIQIVMVCIWVQPHFLSCFRCNIWSQRRLHLFVLPRSLHFDVFIRINGQVLFLFLDAVYPSIIILIDLIHPSLSTTLLRRHILVRRDIRISHTESLLMLVTLDITLMITHHLNPFGAPDVFLNNFPYFAVISLPALPVKPASQSRSGWRLDDKRGTLNQFLLIVLDFDHVFSPLRRTLLVPGIVQLSLHHILDFVYNLLTVSR